MEYAFKQFTIQATNVPQPVIFTTLTAAYAPGVVPGQSSVLTVADTSIFNIDDRVWVDQQGNAENVRIIAIGSATSMTVEAPSQAMLPTHGLRLPHAVGAFVAMSMAHAGLTLANPLGSNTHTIYVFSWGSSFGTPPTYGRDSLVPSTSTPYPLLIGLLLAGGGTPVTAAYSRGGIAPGTTGNIWVAGTVGDPYFVILTTP